MILGGSVGFLFFYYISHFIIISTKLLKPVAMTVTPYHLRDRYKSWKLKRKLRRKPKKKFTKRNRMIVRMRMNYGMWAIILLTPIALSIPVGAFLLRKYYEDRRFVVVYALSVLVIEGIILCVLFYQMPDLNS